MTITIKQARKIIGKENIGYTDEQIEEMISTASLLANLAINSYIKHRPKIQSSPKKI